MIRNTWRTYYGPERNDVFAGFRTCAPRVRQVPHDMALKRDASHRFAPWEMAPLYRTRACLAPA